MIKGFMKKSGWLWLLIVLLTCAGLLLCFITAGYSTSGLLCFGLAALILIFWLLWVLKRRRPRLAKVLTAVVSVCLVLGLIAVGVTGSIIAEAAAGQPGADCEYIILLGSQVRGTEPSPTQLERLNAAYAYLIAHPDTVCVVSGGKGEDEEISEALCMFRKLTEWGIDPERVWMEDQSKNTRENLAFSLALIETRAGSRPETVGVVSSEYHLYRAGIFAAEQGVTACGIPAKTERIFLRLNYYLREILAVWYYTLLGG